MPETLTASPTKKRLPPRSAITPETSQLINQRRWAKVKAEKDSEEQILNEIKSERLTDDQLLKSKSKRNVLLAAYAESEKYVRDLFAGRKKTQQDAWRLGLLYDKITREDEPARVNNLVINLFGGTKIGEKLTKTIEAIDAKSITYTTHPPEQTQNIISEAVEVIDNQEK